MLPSLSLLQPDRSLGRRSPSSSSAHHMRAAVIREVEPDHTLPQRQPGQVLVEVHAASVNPIDLKASAVARL